MTPVSLADIEVALRALLAAPGGTRAALARDLLAAAQEGACHRRTTGAAHPRHGTGTLMSAAFAHPLAPRPAAYDAEVLGALSILINALTVAPAHQQN